LWQKLFSLTDDLEVLVTDCEEVELGIKQQLTACSISCHFKRMKSYAFFFVVSTLIAVKFIGDAGAAAAVFTLLGLCVHVRHARRVQCWLYWLPEESESCKARFGKCMLDRVIIVVH